MENELAADQARKGDGVVSHSVAIGQLLNELKTSEIDGYVSAWDVIGVLKRCTQVLLSNNPHPKGSFAVAIELKVVSKVVVSLFRVTGRQLQLESPESLEQRTKQEARVVLAANKVAARIATAVNGNQEFSAERLEEMINESPNKLITMNALRAIRPGAPQVMGTAGALPRINGEKLPNSYRSNKPHRVMVQVQGGVNSITWEVSVGIVKVIDSNDLLNRRIGSSKVFKIKCATPEDLQYFLAAQCADATIEVVLSANIPLYQDPRRPQVSLHLVEILSTVTRKELLAKAVEQLELAF